MVETDQHGDPGVLREILTVVQESLEASQDLSADTGVSMLVCFDHEEIGSDSAQGAGSPVMSEAISRVLGCFDQSSEMLLVTIRKSFLISADVAHAIHPNYPEKHEKNHQPVLNKGTVIKTNQNQRYATNAETGFLLREIARRAGAPIQVRRLSGKTENIELLLFAGVRGEK